MGTVQSSGNHIKQLNEITTRIIQENSQTCQVNSSQIQSIVASGDCQNITIKNTDFSQLAGVDFTCLQEASLNAKILNDLKQQFDQMAKSMASGFPTSIFTHQDTQNFVDLHNILANEIVNRVTQACIVNAGQYQGIVCTGGSILVQDSTFKQIIESIFDCAQKGETVADVSNQISTIIKQVAISESKGLSFDILFIFLILLVVGGAIFILNKATDWRFLAIGLPILGIIVFIIYLLIANKRNWWPFKSKFDDKKRTPPAPIPPSASAPLPAPPAPPVSTQVTKSMPSLTSEQCPRTKKLTAEQYRTLKYGDAQFIFDKPYQKKTCQ